MYSKIAQNITERYIQKNIISEEKRAVYKYGFEVLFSTIVYTLIFIIIALLSYSVFPSLFFWLGFFIVRKLCGGYHAATYLKCHLLFALNHLAFVAAFKYVSFVKNPIFMSVSLVICSAMIFIFAPVDHPNKPFKGDECKKFRNRSKQYCIIVVSVAVISYMGWVTHNTLLFGYMFGTVSATISLLSAKIQKQRRKI